jgi:ribosomal protein L37E
MGADLPAPRVSWQLLCVRCGRALFYVRQDRARGVLEHHYECRRCGQKHAAWSNEWNPAGMGSPQR